MATILVIDDDIDVAETIQSLLELKGFDVVLATDGKRGLTALDTVGWSGVDLVITDLVMPQLDGFGFLRVYGQHPQPRPPVLAMSSMHAYLDTAVALGAAAALLKPFETRDLMAHVRALTSGKTPSRPAASASPDPDAEARRLLLIDELRLEAPDMASLFGPFVDRVAAHVGVPMCLLSIIDRTRQYWSAGCGIPLPLQSAHGGARQDAFCTHAVEARSPLIVQDAAENPVFADNVLVRTQSLRFYAGVPVFTITGEAVGTLCVLDFRPRDFSHSDLKLLFLMARRASAEVERRERLLASGAAVAIDDHAHVVDEETGAFARPSFIELVGIEAARCIERTQTLVLLLIDLHPSAAPDVVRRLEACYSADWVGRLSPTRLGLPLAGTDGPAARRRVAEMVGRDGVVSAVDLTGRVASGLDLVRIAATM